MSSYRFDPDITEESVLDAFFDRHRALGGDITTSFLSPIVLLQNINRFGFTRNEVMSWCDEVSTVDVVFVVGAVNHTMTTNPENRSLTSIYQTSRARKQSVSESTVPESEWVNLLFLSMAVFDDEGYEFVIDWEGLAFVVGAYSLMDVVRMMTLGWTVDALRKPIDEGVDASLVLSMQSPVRATGA